MPLANIFLLCALAFPGVQSMGVFSQDSQPQKASSNPDQGQESPKAAQPEPSKPEQSTPPPGAVPDSHTQSPPPTTQTPGAEPGEAKPAQAPSSADKESSGEKKTTQPARKCHAPSSEKANSGPKARVVRRGSTTEPAIQFAPGLTTGQAAAQRQSTNQLLASAKANLNKISSQQLSPSQQESVNQIRKYMEQAKTADTSGDLQRAHNLAFKARLLSDELLRK
jgi:hypothetical protein